MSIILDHNKLIKKIKKRTKEVLKQYENHPEFTKHFNKGEKKKKRSSASTRKDKEMEK
jgi:hypothetical protein